ncbi:MAG: hypothetical protein AAF726_15180 [Planctomycetota bacterium]
MSLSSILLAVGLAGAHPISNYALRLELTPEATLLSIDFTYDDVVMLGSARVDDDGSFSPEALRTALVEFQRRVEEGTGLFDADGVRQATSSVTLTGATEPPRLEYAAVGETQCTLTLRYPALDRPRESSILFDWGGWRKSISSLFYCRWSIEGGEEGRVLWDERHRFPLLPPEDTNTIRHLDERYALPRPLVKSRTGFSYLYVEADHVRHELVLPLMSLAWEIMPYESELSIATVLGDEERVWIEELVEERVGTESPLTINGALSEPSETHVRWFTRDSLRRGLASDDDAPIPLPTGFVGMLSIHPVDEAVRRLAFDSSEWLDLLNDHVVSVVVGEETERFVLESSERTLEWSGEVEITPAPLPTQVAFVEPRRIAILGWAALAALVAALPLVARQRRAALTLGSLSAALGLAYVFVPMFELEEGDGRSVLEALLQNTYLACGRQDEREALELLTMTSDGELLEELYLDLRGQLSGPWATGAGTAIQGVRLTDCDLVRQEPRRLMGLCSWNVDARIEHWGHVHDRSLDITGRLTAEAYGGRWRFGDVVLLDKQISSASSRPRR